MPTFTKAGVKRFTHVQSTLSDTWIIAHDFGYKPIFDLILDDISPGMLEKSMPKYVTYPSDTTMILTFVTPRKGKAVLS